MLAYGEPSEPPAITRTGGPKKTENAVKKLMTLLLSCLLLAACADAAPDSTTDPAPDSATDPVTELPSAVPQMASSTKPILGVAAMMMIEESLFKPGDPVEKYVPEFKDVQVAVPEETRERMIFFYEGKAGSKSDCHPTSECSPSCPAPSSAGTMPCRKRSTLARLHLVR